MYVTIKASCIANESIKPRTVGFYIICHKASVEYISVYDVSCLTTNQKESE